MPIDHAGCVLHPRSFGSAVRLSGLCRARPKKLRPRYVRCSFENSRMAARQRSRKIGEITLIKEVADRDEIHRRWRTGGEVIADRRDLDTVQFGVEAERGEGVAFDLSRDHLACSGFRRSDADDARTRAEVENATARHRLRPVEDVAGRGRATGPMISPVGWQRSGPILVQLGKTPKTARWMGCVKSDFGKRGDRGDAHVRPDEPQRLWSGAPRASTAVDGNTVAHGHTEPS